MAVLQKADRDSPEGRRDDGPANKVMPRSETGKLKFGKLATVNFLMSRRFGSFGSFVAIYSTRKRIRKLNAPADPDAVGT
jgi:hypothetical protein